MIIVFHGAVDAPVTAFVGGGLLHTFFWCLLAFLALTTTCVVCFFVFSILLPTCVS